MNMDYLGFKIEHYAPAALKNNPVQEYLNRDKSKDATCGEKPELFTKESRGIFPQERIDDAIKELQDSIIWNRETRKYYEEKGKKIKKFKDIGNMRKLFISKLLELERNDLIASVCVMEKKEEKSIKELINYLISKV